VINLLENKIKDNNKINTFKKKKLMQNDNIAQNRIPDKTNVERWNQKKKLIIQKDIQKNEGEKKTLIRGQIKIFSWRVELNWKIDLTKERKSKE
jgi:hypothetical protein